MTEKMKLSDIGPITNLEIPVPEEGGLVVLRGGQGVGKSTALKAASKMLGGSPKGLTTRDGRKSGKLQFGDVRLTVHRARTTKKGSLEIAEIESRLDIGKLINPGIENPESADNARIKALVSLTGVKADKTHYYELVGGETAYDELGVDDDTEDPVLLASRVKTALEKVARSWERNSDNQRGHAQAAVEAAEGVDPNEPADRVTLQSVYDAARDQLVRLEEQNAAYESAERIHDEAKRKIKAAEEKYKGPTVEQAREALEAQAKIRDEKEAEEKRLEQIYDQAREAMREAQRALEQKQSEAMLARKDWEQKKAAIDSAQRQESTIRQWRDAVDRQLPDPVIEEEMLQAKQNVQKGLEAVERGVLVREAQEKLLEAQKHVRNAQEAARMAEAMRDKASDVDNVLSEALPKCALRIEGGRLVTATDRSQSELFAELSDGERTKIAIELAAKQLPAHGILCLSQMAYEGQQPANKAAIDALAKELKIVILAAEATDDDLHAEEFASGKSD